MRRVTGFILLGLGVFGLALAALLPTYVYSELAKVPLDQDTTTVLTGKAARAMVLKDRGSGPQSESRENIDVEVVSKVQSNFSRPEMREGSPVAVWLEATQMRDKADNTLIFAGKRQVCFDRRTSVGFDPRNSGADAPSAEDSSFLLELDDEAQVIPGKPAAEVQVPRAQLGQNFKYPFDTQAHDYEVYDTTMRRPATVTFTGVETVSGIQAYRFEQHTPMTQLGSQVVPGSLVGLDEKATTVGVFYQNDVTQWVDPVTGVIINQKQGMREEFRQQGAQTGPTAFDGVFSYDDKTVANSVAKVEQGRGKLNFLASTGPIIFGVLGGVLLCAGVLLLIRDYRRERIAAGDEVLVPGRYTHEPIAYANNAYNQGNHGNQDIPVPSSIGRPLVIEQGGPLPTRRVPRH